MFTLRTATLKLLSAAKVTFVLGALAICASAQNIVFTQGSVGSGLENNLQVPLRSYPGRGAANLPVTLTYTSRVWRIAPITTINNNLWFNYQTITEAIYAENSTAGWKTSLDLPIIEWPRNDDTYYYTGKPYCHVCGSNLRQFRVARVYITMPDGSKHELRKGDQPYEGAIDMFGTFYAVDGSRMRYDSTGQNTGTLYLPDGARYVLNGSTAQFIDRNGNKLNYDASTRQWTDTQNRVINMPLPANPTVGEQLYYVPGMPLPYKFIWKNLSDTGVLTPLPGGGTPTRKTIANEYLPFPNSPPTPPSGNNFPVTIVPSYSEIPSLFISDFADEEDMGPPTIVVGRGQVGAALFNPVVLAEIVLPNNLSYKFTYNIYGEIDKVVYPTGAFERYTFSKIPAIGDVKPPYSQASRGVTLRQLSANGTGSDLLDWVYSSTGAVITTTQPLGGARTEIYRKVLPTPEHQGTHGSITKYWPFGFEDARQGEIYEERIYAPGPTGALLRRSIKELDQTSNTVAPSIPQLDPTNKTAYRNSRITKHVSLILDTGGNALVKTVGYEHAANGYELTTGLDVTASNEYHFASVDQATAQTGAIAAMPIGNLASRAETAYLDNAAYRSRNILGLPTSVIVKDPNLMPVSKTESFYDEAAYPLIVYGDLPSASYTDPGTGARANVTTVKRYFDITGGLFLETHAQFDQCGNSVSTWNERNNQSQTQYSSTYSHAYVTGTTSAVPDPDGVTGSNTALTTSTVYDATTGLVLSSTDANGQVTNFSYQDDLGVTDPLTRIRKTTRADGGFIKTEYNDVAGDFFVYTQTKQDATHITKSWTYFDPLGRTSRSFISEDGTNYLATDTLYDGLGHTWKTSSTYRTTQRDGVASESHTTNWTTSLYDAMDRVTLVTMADGSTVQTAYEGVYTTTTDPAGKKRRQQTDALGRITRVDEPDSSGNLGSVTSPTQPTSYEYNTRGEVIHVTQNAQHRYFRYDAIGRLTHERQVEPLVAPFTTNDAQTPANPTTNSAWTRRLIYDETLFGKSYKGLATGMYDARQILSQTLYDNLNRPVSIGYSDGVTPTASNFYDNPKFTVAEDPRTVMNRGRLSEVRTAALGPNPATSQFTNYDLMGHVIQSRQTVGANTYTLSYAYNIGGMMTSQTYPSGRVVNYSFDDATRLSQVTSGATTYASQFVYASSGLLSSVTFGNGAVQSFGYNARLQLSSLDLTKSGTQIQHFDYKYGVFDPVANTLDETKNNGQVAQIEGLIGTVKQWQQRFTYDNIGRLTTAREKRGDNNQQSYLVNYDYDAYGNRYQYSAQNGGNPFPQVFVEAGHISTANNRFTANVTYDNAGNITTDAKFRNKQYLYDANNRLRWSANLDNSGAETSVYDGTGQRLATIANGDITSISVYDATGNLVAEYGQSTSNGTQYIVNDHQGSPRVITSAAGTVISRHDYLPFGEELAPGIGMRTSGQGYGGADGIEKKYAGMETDSTGMAHTLWRKYDQLAGRWTTTDPYGGSMAVADPQSFNRYTYVNNDPVNAVDPTGMMLSDIGVYQTDNAGDARMADQASMRDFLKAINDDYNAQHNWILEELQTSGVPAVFEEPAASEETQEETTVDAAEEETESADEGEGGGQGQEQQQQQGGTQTVDAGPLGSQPMDPFKTQEDAAVAGMQKYNPISIKEDLEYAGSVCELPKKQGFIFSIPNVGTADSSIPSPCPSGTTEVANWHTHGAGFKNDPADSSERYSPQDRKWANGIRKTADGAIYIGPALPLYLATPSGTIKRFDPNLKKDPFLGAGTPFILKQRTPTK
jgi:RHS repeat-associated protein